MTCIDTDDDNMEFEDAGPEEEDDVYNGNHGPYMVSKANVSKYVMDQSARNTQLPPEKQVHIPNKILDSVYLK